MKKFTLHDIITLHLADIGDWVAGYQLSKLQTKWGWVGSSGERRARELAEAGEHIVKGMVYTIERRQIAKYVEYRVSNVEQKKPKFDYIPQPDGSMKEVPVAPLSPPAPSANF